MGFIRERFTDFEPGLIIYRVNMNIFTVDINSVIDNFYE